MIRKCSADFLKKVVLECMQQLGPPRGNMAEYGTRLAKAVTDRLRKEGLGDEALSNLHVGRCFKTFPQFPPELAGEEIEAFCRRQPGLASRLRDLEPLFWRKPRKGKPYKRRIGRMIPDFLVELPDGTLIVWDLTSHTNEEHIAKTLLYAEIASVSRGGVNVQVGEFHYISPDPIHTHHLPPGGTRDNSNMILFWR